MRDVKPTKKKTTKKTASKPKASAQTKAKAKVAAKKPAPKAALRRADLGAPIDGFFAKQPPQLRPIVDALRAMVEKTAPDATSSLKWGMPFYAIGRGMMCAIGAHKAHVNLILSGPPGTFDDPDGLLQGDGKTGRHLKLQTLDDLPRAAVTRWLKAAAQLARKNA